MRKLIYSLLLLLFPLVANGQDASSTDQAVAEVHAESSKFEFYDPVSKTYFQPQPLREPGFSLAEVTDVQSRSLKIAILDSGILHSHPLFKGINILDKDFTGEGPEDRNGHGTLSVLLQLGQYPSNLLANPQFLNVKVLDKDGRGDPETIRLGMEWAVGQGAVVLGMSLGVPKVLAPELCEYATQLLKAHPGLQIVAANGNDKSFEMCPAAAEGVTAVAASEKPMKPLVMDNESLIPIEANSRGSSTMHEESGADVTSNATLKFPKRVVIGTTPKLAAPEQDSAENGFPITAPGTVVLVPLGSNYQPYTKIDPAVLSEPLQRKYVEAFNGGDFAKTHNLIRQSSDLASNLSTIFGRKVTFAEKAGDCAQAIAFALLLRQVNIESNKKLETTLYHLGLAYKCNGEYPRSALALAQAAEIYVSWGDRLNAAMTLNLLGQLEAVDEGLPQAGLETFKRAARVASYSDDAERTEADALGNICLLEFALRDYDQSLVDCLEVSKRCGARYKDYWVGESLLTIGRIYEELNDVEAAVKYFNKAKTICTQDSDKLCENAATTHLTKVGSTH